jgi:hypothetical protein
MMALNEIEQVVLGLPPAAQRELQDFVDYLRHKYRADVKQQVAQLRGLWADVDFDVSDEDVRALRRKVTNQLMEKL